MQRSDRQQRDAGDGADAPSASSGGLAPSATEELLTPGEVAELFGVDPKTVSRWADAGKLAALRTLGGHRRYRSREVRALLQDAAS